VRFSTYKSRFCDILLASTDGGICRLEFSSEPDDFARRLKQQYGGPVVRDDRHFVYFKKKLDTYFQGGQVEFSEILDISGTDFQNMVWSAVSEIEYGKVEPYGNIAQKIGAKNAYRAVGNALGMNPVPLIIPCHRVTGSDGGLGGFSAGIGLKRVLLRIEGHKQFG
jgi:O-6-methylguanine DNA methyltransferase